MLVGALRKYPVVRLGVLSLFLGPPSADAGDRLKLGAVLDARVVTAPGTASFLDGGLGKARYGGTERTLEATLSQAALLGRFEFRPDLSVDAHLRLDAEADLGRRADLVEAFVRYAPGIGDTASLEVRAGLFFPTGSLENTDPGWLSPYTVSFSAINSWIGEEVRTLGVEAGPAWRIGETRARLLGTLARSNDPSGTLLAWRGFALHDRVSGASDRLPLAPLRSFERPDLFPDQAPYTQPLLEVDGRWTWSTGLSLDHPRHRVRVRYQPPTADRNAFDGRQYAWRTSFLSAGAARHFGPVEVVAQGLQGRTQMGIAPEDRPAVSAAFRSAFLLTSWSSAGSKHRLSLRYDAFDVRDEDDFILPDPNDESGDSWTLAYSVMAGARSRLTAEVLRVDSSRRNRADLGLPEQVREVQGTLSCRITF